MTTKDRKTTLKSPAESLSFRQSLLQLLEAGPDREEKLLEEFVPSEKVPADRAVAFPVDI